MSRQPFTDVFVNSVNLRPFTSVSQRLFKFCFSIKFWNFIKLLILEALHLQLFINLDQVSMNSELSCWIDFNILIKTSYWNKDLTLILYSVVMKFRQLFIDNFVNFRPLTSVSFKFNFTDKVLTELQLYTVNSI